MRIRSISRSNIRTPLALPPGELSPKVTERYTVPINMDTEGEGYP